MMFLGKSTLRIALPLCLTREQADHAIEIIERSTKDFVSGKVPAKKNSKIRKLVIDSSFHDGRSASQLHGT